MQHLFDNFSTNMKRIFHRVDHSSGRLGDLRNVKLTSRCAEVRIVLQHDRPSLDPLPLREWKRVEQMGSQASWRSVRSDMRMLMQMNLINKKQWKMRVRTRRQDCIPGW